MNAPVLSRRHLLGATAAVGAVGLPALAETGIPASVSTDPDAGLVDLIAQFDAAFAARNAHTDLHDAADRRFREAAPPRPAALTSSIGDSVFCLGSTGRERRPDGRLYGFFTREDVARLRVAGPVMDVTYDEDGRPVSSAPSPRGEARRQRILEASDAWEAEKRALADRVGLTAAKEEDDRLYKAVREARDAIRDLAPVTAEGLRRKVVWVVKLDDPEEEAAALVEQVAVFGAAS